MLNKNNLAGIVITFVMFTVPFLNAQNEISSPYSGFGVGIVNSCTPSALSAMGGVAYAIQNPYLINFRNPASYVAFDSLSFIADASFSINSNVLRSNGLKQKSTIATPNYITIGLPLTKHWRTSVGFLPYSNLGYGIIDNHTVENFGENKYTYSGDGGLMQLYWGNAFKLCKGLSLGLNVSYMWGRLSYSRSVEIPGDNFFNTTVNTSNHVDGIYLSAGLQYFVDIKEKHRLGFGVVYERSAYIWARQNELITLFEGELGNYTGYDTLSNKLNQRGSMKMPQTIGGGLSYNYDNRLIVAADYNWQNWSDYSIMDETDSALCNSHTVNIGVQYTPNPLSSKYGKRISIRAGAKYSTGYFKFDGKQILNYSLSFGLGFPLKGTNTNSSLSVMFEYDKWGNVANNLISEDIYKITISFTLQEKWYQRTKLD